MTPQHLAQCASNLGVAADIVDAIKNRELQQERGWDLRSWRFELVPWGVRFIHWDIQEKRCSEVVVRLPSGLVNWPV